MPCGHIIGRSAMNKFMRNMVTEKECEIRCFFEECNACRVGLCFMQKGCFTRGKINFLWILSVRIGPKEILRYVQDFSTARPNYVLFVWMSTDENEVGENSNQICGVVAEKRT